MTTCKAGFAQVNITPDFPVELIGCYRADPRAQGVAHDLYAQVLLFEREGARHCLIAVDSLGLTTALSRALKEMVAQALSTHPDRVMLGFSHTHSAPAPLSPLNGQRYFALLCQRVKACALEAVRALAPCLVAWAAGRSTIGDNRRDGCHVVDDRLAALQVVNAQSGAPIALLLRVCAHANILMGASNALSSDYFGPARDKIGAHFGCPVMLVQGASGNLKPVGVDKIQGGNMGDVERIAQMLYACAANLTFAPRPVTRLAMAEREIHLFSDVPTGEEAAAIAQRAGFPAPDWLAECARLRDAGITCQQTAQPMQLLAINEGCLVGVPDEVFCELALMAADEAHDQLLLLNGYTNGTTGYLPHRAEWVKGGYETFDSYLTYYPFHGHVLPFRVGTGEHIARQAVEFARKIGGATCG